MWEEENYSLSANSLKFDQSKVSSFSKEFITDFWFAIPMKTEQLSLENSTIKS